MKLAIVQPYFMPYIGYWQLMKEVDKFIFYDDVNYIKKGYINRNNLLINDEAKRFNIPLVGASQNRLICDIEVDYSQKWEKKLLNTIYLSYKKARHFEIGYEMISEIVESKKKSISDLIVFSTIKIASHLEIDTDFEISSNLEYDRSLKGQEKIMELCKKMNASHYINPQGGMDIYENGLFVKNNIDLSFLSTNQLSYDQFGKADFIPNLSILDVIMHNSVEQIKELLTQFDLQSKS